MKMTVEELQARRAARGMADPLNRLRAIIAASDARPVVECPNHGAALRALGVESMTPAQIYQAREYIAGHIIRARDEAQEYQGRVEARARGHACRHYVETIAARFESVIKP